MRRECPEWAAYIGVVVRLLTNEIQGETDAIASLLRQIDERERAMHASGDRGWAADH
jgi:hypothetical protein